MFFKIYRLHAEEALGSYEHQQKVGHSFTIHFHVSVPYVSPSNSTSLKSIVFDDEVFFTERVKVREKGVRFLSHK